MKKAKVDVFVGFKGDNVRISEGVEYADDDPLVEAYPAMFEDVPKKRGRPLGSTNKPKAEEK